MKLCFYKAPGGFYDKLIRVWNGKYLFSPAKYSHVGMWFDNGMYIQASAREKGVTLHVVDGTVETINNRRLSKIVFDPGKWDFLESKAIYLPPWPDQVDELMRDETPVGQLFTDMALSIGMKVTSSNRHEVAEWKHERALDYALSQLGRPYDWKGILWFIGRLGGQDKLSWYCSELVVPTLKRAGEGLALPEQLHPQRLFDLLTNEGPAKWTFING
jgi:hypothetical protein